MPTKGLYRKPDSPYWWASYTDASGKRVRRSTGVPVAGGAASEMEAEALLGKWRAEAHQEKMWGRAPEAPPPVHLFGDVMMLYFTDRVSAQRGGLARAKSTAKHLYLAFHGRDMATIAEVEIKAYARQRQAEGAAAGTINKEIVMLGAACEYAKSVWIDVPNPAGGRGKKLREPQGRDRWLSPDEAAGLVAAAAESKKAPWLLDFVELALNTGARAGEILGLRWDEVDMQARVIRLERTKSGRRRAVPLNDVAYEAIRRRASFRASCANPASPWVFCGHDGEQIGSIKTAWRLMLKRAGIEDFRIHDLRHSAATAMVRARVPIYEVAEVLGHASVKTTQRYAHHDPDSLRSAVDSIEATLNVGAKSEQKHRA